MWWPESLSSLWRRNAKRDSAPEMEADKSRWTHRAPPPGSTRKRKDPWWAIERELENQDSAIFLSFAEDSAKLSRLVHTGHLTLVKLPPAARELIALADHGGHHPKALAKIVGHAPYLLSRATLRAAKISQESVTQLDTLPPEEYEAALRYMLRDMMHDITQAGCKGMEEDGETLFEHSAATGVAAWHLCKELHIKARLPVYVAALLHDLGEAVITWTMARHLTPLPPLAMRQDFRSTLHEEAASFAVKRWQLPKRTARLVAHHHTPLDAEDPQNKLRALVQLSELIALACGHGEEVMPCAVLAHPAAALFGITEENAEAILGGIPSEMIKATLM